MLGRRLLLAGSGGSFVVPAREFTVTAAPYGAWPGGLGGTPFYYGGKTYFGFADNAGGSYAASFDHATGTVTMTLLHTFATADQHNRPALVRRSSDGKIVAIYCAHSGPAMYVRVSTNADDISAFGAETDIASQLGGSAYTYPVVYEIPDDGNDLLLFFRESGTGASKWCLPRSTDGGTTWSSGVGEVLYSGTRVYGRCAKSGTGRLDFAFTTGSYAEEYASVYHAYYQGGAFYDSAGSVIVEPFSTAEMTLVYDGASAGARYIAGSGKIGSDIAVLFPVQTGTPSGHIGEDEDYIYARWNGSAWSTHTIVSAVGATTLEFTEGALTLDPADLGRVFLSQRVSGTWRIHEATTADSGATWSIVQRTSSGDDDMYPEFVLDHAPELEVVWLKGTFTSQSVYDTGIEGWGTAA